MYWNYALIWLRLKWRRKQLFDISKRLSKETKKLRIFIMIDMIYCSLKYGAMYTEYENLNFCKKKAKQRATYFTTFQEFRLAKILNLQDYRTKFHDKITFLQIFGDCVNREWIFTESPIDEIESFISNHKTVVLKGKMGDSGKQVEVYNIPDGMTADELLEYMKANQFDLAEEYIVNHPDVARLNESSLNTVRIATIASENKCDFLFAGIRVGASGSKLDNLSQGGSIARIDLETGKLDSPFYYYRAVYAGNECEKKQDMIGYQLPYWQELLEMVKAASSKIPQIRLVSWDVCITENGPQLVEGNESFGCEIMQLFDNDPNHGLKPRLQKILNEQSIEVNL